MIPREKALSILKTCLKAISRRRFKQSEIENILCSIERKKRNILSFDIPVDTHVIERGSFANVFILAVGISSHGRLIIGHAFSTYSSPIVFLVNSKGKFRNASPIRNSVSADTYAIRDKSDWVRIGGNRWVSRVRKTFLMMNIPGRPGGSVSLKIRRE